MAAFWKGMLLILFIESVQWCEKKGMYWGGGRNVTHTHTFGHKTLSMAAEQQQSSQNM